MSGKILADAIALRATLSDSFGGDASNAPPATDVHNRWANRDPLQWHFFHHTRRFDIRNESSPTPLEKEPGMFRRRSQRGTVRRLRCEKLENRFLLTNLALNPTRTGFPHPDESDRGWGGGADKWDILDGERTYPYWANGLAFTGGNAPWVEPAGYRQSTVNFGSPQTFDKVIIWHHGHEHVPATTELEYWNGTSWVDIAADRDFGRIEAGGAGSTSDEYTFSPVTGSKVRYSFDNSELNILGAPNVHGWLYEFEVFAVEEPDLVATQLDWVPGGVQFSYEVRDADLPETTTAALYWAKGSTRDDIIAGPFYNAAIETTEGSYGPSFIPVGGTIVPEPPAGATQLLLVLDPENRIAESDEPNDGDFGQNNILHSAIPSVIIDDGDPLPAYSEHGDLGIPWTDQGFQGDVREMISDGKSVTYTFDGLTPGDIYDISVTWTEFLNRETEAPYTIMGALGGATTVLVDQTLAPDDFAADGAVWERLGTFTVDPQGTLGVTLAGTPNRKSVIADAVRIDQRVDAEIAVTFAATDLESGSSTVDFGSAILGAVVTRELSIHNLGAADLILQPLALPANSPFEVVETYTQGGVSISTLAPGTSASFVIGMKTDSVGAKHDTLTFANSDIDESPFSIALSGIVRNAISIVDDGDPEGYSDTGNPARWTQQGFIGTDGFSDVHEAAAGGVAQSATFTFPGLPAGTYRISATWTPLYNRASNAPYTINGSAPILINQKLSPGNPSSTPTGGVLQDPSSGIYFADLDSAYLFSGGALVVQVSDNLANGNVIIDAVRVEKLATPPTAAIVSFSEVGSLPSPQLHSAVPLDTDLQDADSADSLSSAMLPSQESSVTVHDHVRSSYAEAFAVSVGPSGWQNPTEPMDCNNDGSVTAFADILARFGELSRHVYSDAFGNLRLPPPSPVPSYYDLDGDNRLTPVQDVLPVINHINSHFDEAPEGLAGIDTHVRSLDYRMPSASRSPSESSDNNRLPPLAAASHQASGDAARENALHAPPPAALSRPLLGSATEDLAPIGEPAVIEELLAELAPEIAPQWYAVPNSRG